jgi:hypothetical protein
MTTPPVAVPGVSARLPRRARGGMAGSGTIGGVSPPMPPGPPPGEGPPGDWPRGPGPAVRRPRRDEPERPAGAADTSDPYGWSGSQSGPATGPDDVSWLDSDGADPWGGQPPGPGGPARGERRRATDRLRRPHKRRAQAGQQTGLDPSLQSALPSWLGTEQASGAPARRLVSLSVAAFAALLGFGLIAGAQSVPGSYAIVIFGVQILFVLSWAVATRPPGLRVVVGIGLAAAVLADLGAVWPEQPSLSPLGYVAAAAFAAGVIGQLARGERRFKVTESLGATLILVVGVVAFASLVVLGRHVLGTQAIVVGLTSAGVSLVVARFLDALLPARSTGAPVPRRSAGVVLGGMAGTAAAAVAGSYLVGVSAGNAALVGLVTAMAAVMADLAVSYVEAGRRLAGEASRWWIARHLQGPLAGFALAAPAVYVLSVMLLVPAL